MWCLIWLGSGLVLAGGIVASENVIWSGERHPGRARVRVAVDYIDRHFNFLLLCVLSGLLSWLVLAVVGCAGTVIWIIGNNGGFQDFR